MGWWRVSFVCPAGWEDDFASALGDLTGAPTCTEPCQTGTLVWTSLPDGPRRFSSRELELSLGRLAASLAVPPPPLRVSRVTEEEWLHKWKEFFSPVVIGGRLLVRPPWIAPGEYGPGKDVVIRPGLAFGTGLHATTKMSLESLAEMVRPDDVALDVGAGSGILSIAACKLGARLAVAVDNDLVALGECRRNCRENGVAGQTLIMSGSLVEPLRGRWDVLVCNIDAVCAGDIARKASNYLEADGVLILAGFTDEKEEDVREALTEGDFEVEGRRQEGPWVCLSARREG